MDVSLLIGLGNPGRRYRRTRHNIGFAVVSAFAGAHGFEIEKKRFDARYALCEVFGKKICVVQPQNFMNLSGPPVVSFWNYYKAAGRGVMVVHDDIDMALGRIRIAFGSGGGGHNGVRSVIEHAGTKDFWQLKIGVGRPPEGVDPADYVLCCFDEGEKDSADEAVCRAVHAIDAFYGEGPARAMGKYNK